MSAPPSAAAQPLSADEKALLAHVTMWGSDGYPIVRIPMLRSVLSRNVEPLPGTVSWSWSFGALSSPKFRTRKAAVAHLEDLLESFRRRLGEIAYRAAVAS